MNSVRTIFLSSIRYDPKRELAPLLLWTTRTGAGRLDGFGVWCGGAKKTNVAPKLGAGMAPTYSRSAIQGFSFYIPIQYPGWIKFLSVSGICYEGSLPTGSPIYFTVKSIPLVELAFRKQDIKHWGKTKPEIFFHGFYPTERAKWRLTNYFS
jgi:hypothetical protein